MQNLILGIAVAVIGLVITAMPTHGCGLSWVLIPIGVWQIISPWVVGERPTGVLWTNVVMGAIVTVLGLGAAGLLVTSAVSVRRPRPFGTTSVWRSASGVVAVTTATTSLPPGMELICPSTRCVRRRAY